MANSGNVDDDDGGDGENYPDDDFVMIINDNDNI